MRQQLLGLVLGVSLAAADMDWSKPSQWYKGFGYKKGDWRVDKHPRMMVDVNGDGRADVVGFENDGVRVALSTGSSFASSTRWYIGFFGYKKGDWRVDKHPRMVVDVNGDGKADVVGFGGKGVYVALSTGSSFASASRWYKGFEYEEGNWRVEKHPRMVVDVNGDGRADVVGFGNGGVYVALSTGSSFASASRWYKGFGYEQGDWRVEKHPRMMVDVNGDGKADVVGFGDKGVYVALSTGSSFASASRWYKGFAYKEGDWRVEKHPRMMVDVNGDGKADVVGFGDKGVNVALSTGSSFASASRWYKGFAYKEGDWRVEKHPRMAVDVNGDGKADVVAFGDKGVYVALSTGSMFAKATLEIEAFGYKKGDWRVGAHPRMVVDVNGDGKADIVGFGNEGVSVSVGVFKWKTEENPCPPRVRRAWSGLSCTERDLYIRAVRQLEATKRNWYNDMVETYVTSSDYAHSSSAFLPWHRMFLLGYENALRGLGGDYRCVTVPYWDWEIDAGSESQSSVLRADTFGTRFGSNGCVNEGVASGWTVSNGGCLRRSFNPGVGFVGEAEIMAMIRNNPEYRTFRHALERSPHAAPHSYIGGHMASKEPPEDPLFFVHLCNIDRIWAMWQDYWRHDAAITTTSTHYFAEVDHNQVSTSFVQLNSRMPFPASKGGAPAAYFKSPMTINNMMKITSIPGTEESPVNSYKYGPDAMAAILFDIFGQHGTGGRKFVDVGLSDYPIVSCSENNPPPIEPFRRQGKFFNMNVNILFETTPGASLRDLAKFECEYVATRYRATDEWFDTYGVTDAEHVFFEPCGTLLPHDFRGKVL